MENLDQKIVKFIETASSREIMTLSDMLLATEDHEFDEFIGFLNKLLIH